VIARLLLLAGLVALIAALVQWRVVDREPASEEAPPTRPGYYLTGVDLEEFGADGKLRIGLQSISANEDTQSGVVRLSDVAVDYHAPAGQLWHLTADEARVPPGGRVVDFEGDVRLAGRALIHFSEATAEAEKQLKAFMFERVYRSEPVMEPVRRSEALVGELFDRYLVSADMPPRWAAAARAARSDAARARVIADFVAGMTDPYAEAEHARLFDGTGALG